MSNEEMSKLLQGKNVDKDNTLIDPMAFEESPEVMEKKKQKWMDIFMFHPELADRLINLNADKMLPRFWEWAKIYLDHNDFAENVILGLIDAYGDEVYDSLLAIYDGKGSLGWAEKEENK